MLDYNTIIRLKKMGLSNSAIANSLNCKWESVQRIVSRSESIWGSIDGVPSNLTNEELSDMLFTGRKSVDLGYLQPDCEKILAKQRKGKQRNELWTEYCAEAAMLGLKAYKISRFNEIVSEYRKKHDITIGLKQIPGLEAQADWTGDHGHFFDIDSGKIVDVHVFVMTLPYSGYFYCEGFLDEKMESWIAGHANAFKFFGGVPAFIIPDNCATAVDRKHYDEKGILNTSYVEFLEHYGTLPKPTRVKAPKDKGHVERHVRIVEDDIIRPMNDLDIHSLSEFNTIMKMKLIGRNERDYSKKMGSRLSIFNAEEKDTLLPLPVLNFQSYDKKEATVWRDFHIQYDSAFYSVPVQYVIRGNPAKPLRLALGSLLIQKQYGYSDRELVEQITENPYYQYFVGLPGYQMEAPFVPSLLVEFRKRLTDEILIEINEMIIDYNNNNNKGNGTSGPGEKQEANLSDTKSNSGTLMLDATCAPQHIAFPQDINLLNTSREDLEKMIDTICHDYEIKKPRTYRDKARKDYLNLAKSKKRTRPKIRKAIKKQLNFIKRDLGYIDRYLKKGKVLRIKDANRLAVIRVIFEQQETMYKEKKNSIPNRIVSLSQPYIRPIVRGKAKTPTEFGAKIDMSIDENGMARVEKMSFDAYNESDVLIGAIERYYERWKHYPEKAHVDKIYRTRKNLAFCKEHGIRISGPALGRPKKDPSADIKTVYQDAVDRIEVERGFSLAKRNFGLGCIWTKLDSTTRSSIALSIVAMNLHRLTVISFCQFIKKLFSQIRELLSDRKALSFLYAQPILC